ncbi:LapA family protein [Corynebacterium falsenii]|uniref:LapA family protein n=1 Tax=Corynebacterium falsenii TaxID=108486 RepID=UPI0003E950F0|nr:membrane protein [Corynebacterium falsenii DSM 44353]
MTNPYKEPAKNHAPGNDPIDGTKAMPNVGASNEKKPAKNEKRKVKGSVAGTTWVSLTVGLLLLILLIVFILQNQQKVELQLFAWTMNFPIGVGMLIAAIVGALIMVIVGGARIMQLRKQVKR